MQREYKEKQLNEENKWSRESNVKKNEGPFQKVSVKAVVKALNPMKEEKVAAPSGIMYNLLKECKNDSVKKLVKVADELL